MMKKRVLTFGPCLALAIGIFAGWFLATDKLESPALGQTQPAEKLDRTVLPIPEPKVAPITEIDAR